MKATKPLAHPVLSILLLCLIGLTGQARADDGFDRVFIYGDSLSDAGNLYLLTGQVSLPPYLPVPSAPYEVDGERFTNGKTWAEHFAKRLGDKSGSKPSLRPVVQLKPPNKRRKETLNDRYRNQFKDEGSHNRL